MDGSIYNIKDITIEMDLKMEPDVNLDMFKKALTPKILQPLTPMQMRMSIADAKVRMRGCQIKPSEYYVREGSYWPEWLGLYLDGVEWIHVGLCPYPLIQNMTVAVKQFENNFAHAHILTGEICFGSGTFIFDRPGVVSDMLIHEYCHILRGGTVTELMEGDLHDDRWAEIMLAYGLEPSRWVGYICR